VASENVSNSIIEYKHYLFIVSKISRYNAMSVNTISKAWIIKRKRKSEWEEKKRKAKKQVTKPARNDCMYVFLVLYNHFHCESTIIIVRCYFFSTWWWMKKKSFKILPQNADYHEKHFNYLLPFSYTSPLSYF
jgi:hypothetical protein